MAVIDKIKAFYKANTLASMEDSYRHGFTELSARGLLNDEQKTWSGATPPDWRNDTDPITGVVTHIGDDYLEEFYEVLLNTFRAVADDRKSIATNPAITKFLDKYFGAGKIFKPYAANLAHPDLGLLGDLGGGIIAELSVNDDIRAQLGFRSTAAYHDFLNKVIGVAPPPYSGLNDKKIREKFQSALNALSQNQTQLRKNYSEIEALLTNKRDLLAAGAPATDIANADLRIQESLNNLEYSGITSIGGVPLPATAATFTGLTLDTAITDAHTKSIVATPLITNIGKVNHVLAVDINSTPLTAAADLEANVDDILKAFANSKDIREAFMPKMDYEYANAISAGISNTDYKEGKNKISPHYADKKMVFDRAKAKIKDAQDNYLGKYLSIDKRKNMPPVSRVIFDEISALKIKPSDGLAKVVENADKIKPKLPAAAVPDFELMISMLKDLSSTTQFKDALKSGSQMRQLNENIADIISDEKDETKLVQKEAQAKRIQFILNGLSYGLTTSGIRDELKKGDFNIMKGTSMEKIANGFFTNAINFTFKTSFFAAFEITNMAKNKFRGRGAEFGTGTRQVKEIKEAQDYITAHPAFDLSYYNTAADAARVAYETASRNGDKNAEKLKQSLQRAELLVQAKEQSDERVAAAAAGTVPAKKTALDTKLRIMAHWDFVHSGKTNDWAFGNHSRTEKEYHNKEYYINPTTRKTKYEIQRDAQLQQFLNNAGLTI